MSTSLSSLLDRLIYAQMEHLKEHLKGGTKGASKVLQLKSGHCMLNQHKQNRPRYTTKMWDMLGQWNIPLLSSSLQ